MHEKRIIVTGIRGIPAAHGGFETFAQNLAPYLNENNWHVTVYCQEEENGRASAFESEWCGVKLVHIPVKGNSAIASIIFDFLSIRDARKRKGLVLTLGYNTACFNLWLKLAGRTVLFNMDGIEWKRGKWAWYEKIWLYINERLAGYIGNHLIADHPEIKNHLSARIPRNKISMIPYGARDIKSGDYKAIIKYGLSHKDYALVIARPEPENNILEVVRSYSSKSRGRKLVVLGDYSSTNPYQKKVKASASEEVLFLGAIYDQKIVDALRYHSCLYIHGHTVGGTNPSLVEALGAGQPILAHDNLFNRWVAGESAVYFKDEKECEKKIARIINEEDKLQKMSKNSKKKFYEEFTWDIVLIKYNQLLSGFLQ